MDSKCTVGFLMGNVCHSTVYCMTPGLSIVADLPMDTLELLQLRTGITVFESESTICDHHEKMFISPYESLQRQCSDPFNMHIKRVTTSLLS